MTIGMCLGRSLALFVHPAAAWIRLSTRGRLLLMSSYAAASYVAVLTALFAGR
jgi:hypothetical protein